MLNCIFCEIVRGTAGSYVLYEDEEFMAILDKYPVAIGHTLIMPKKHYERINDLAQEDFCALYARVHSLNRWIVAKLNASASHISINDGAAANQLVPHVHVHIIPRKVNDGAGFTSRKLLRPAEMVEVAKKLRTKSLEATL